MISEYNIMVYRVSLVTGLIGFSFAGCSEWGVNCGGTGDLSLSITDVRRWCLGSGYFEEDGDKVGSKLPG